MNKETQTSKLGDIGNVLMCKRVLKSQTTDFGDIPFYKISSFGGKPESFITKELYDKYRKKYNHPKKGDILISAAGTIGKTVIYDGKPAYFQDSNIVWIDNNETKITNSYLYYFYQTKPWLSTDGSTIKRIYNDNLRNIIIKYPDLDTQKQIAKVLSDIDAKIEVNNQINQELEAMAKTLYDYWFVQFDFPDEDGEPYKTSGGKMVYNEELKRDIPEGWKFKTLEEIATIKAGGDKPKKISQIETNDCNIPIYSNGVTNDGLYGYTDLAKISEPSITVSARGTIGFSVLRKKPYVPIIRLISITPNSSFMIKFLHERVKLLEFENSGSVQKQLTVPQVSRLKIIVPSDEQLKKYHQITNPFIEIIENNKKENQKLSELRDWLLPMLMNGQVSVGEAEEKLKLNLKKEVEDYGEVGEEFRIAAEESEKY